MIWPWWCCWSRFTGWRAGGRGIRTIANELRGFHGAGAADLGQGLAVSQTIADVPVSDVRGKADLSPAARDPESARLVHAVGRVSEVWIRVRAGAGIFSAGDLGGELRGDRLGGHVRLFHPAGMHRPAADRFVSFVRDAGAVFERVVCAAREVDVPGDGSFL